MSDNLSKQGSIGYSLTLWLVVACQQRTLFNRAVWLAAVTIGLDVVSDIMSQSAFIS